MQRLLYCFRNVRLAFGSWRRPCAAKTSTCRPRRSGRNAESDVHRYIAGQVKQAIDRWKDSYESERRRRKSPLTRNAITMRSSAPSAACPSERR